MISGRHINALLVFLSITTIISLWSLYLYRFAPVIIVAAAALTFIASKKIDFGKEAISPAALGIALLVALLAAYPFFLNNFVDASADPAAHISSLAIGATMPQTYAPFSQFEYRYQIGFPLLAKAFIDVFPFATSNAIIWFLGILFAFLQALLIYLAAKKFFAGEKAGLIAAALFVGSKIVFQNMYWGQYTFLMATVFFLAAALAFSGKSRLAWIYLPMAFISHPGVAFYALIFFALWAIINKDFPGTAKLFISGFLVIPAFFVSYIHFLTNIGAEQTAPLSPSLVGQAASTFPLWIGGLIFILAACSLWRIGTRKDYSKIDLVLASSFVVSALLFIFFAATGRVIAGRVIELAMLSGLLLSANTLKTFLDARKPLFVPAILAILLISLGLFFTSGQLSQLREGTKITSDEATFAHAFRGFDPEYKRTLFLLENGTKIAEVAQKIPVDVLSGWYLSYDPRIAGNDPYYEEAKRVHNLSQDAMSGNCPDCLESLNQLGFDYLVSRDGNAAGELGMKLVFEHNGYKVFAAPGNTPGNTA
ncbi:MAG: hypothetical protein NUV67_03230 [archaeon]|nr:hypothetical protein [archaeon]